MSAASEREWGIEYEVDSENTVYEWGMSESEARARAHASPTDTGVVSREMLPASEREEWGRFAYMYRAGRIATIYGVGNPDEAWEAIRYIPDLFESWLKEGDWLRENMPTRQSRAEIQAEALREVDEFLDWLISMDDPDDEQGMDERRVVTLTRIIGWARRIREGGE